MAHDLNVCVCVCEFIHMFLFLYFFSSVYIQLVLNVYFDVGGILYFRKDDDKKKRKYNFILHQNKHRTIVILTPRLQFHGK